MRHRLFAIRDGKVIIYINPIPVDGPLSDHPSALERLLDQEQSGVHGARLVIDPRDERHG